MNNTISREVLRTLRRLGYMPTRVAEAIKRHALNSTPFNAYLCARNVVGGRWPEAEEFIASGPKAAFYYAQNIIRGRWPEAEETLGGSSVWFYDYWQHILKKQWPEDMTEGLERARALWGEDPR